MVTDYVTHKIDSLREIFSSNSLTDWLIAGAVGVAVWTVLWIVIRLVSSHYKKYATPQLGKPVRMLGYLAGNIKQFFLFAMALDAAESFLNLPDKIDRYVAITVMILTLLQIGLLAGLAVRFYLETKARERGPDQVFAGSLDIIKFIAWMVIWSLLTLLVLGNLGVNITALLAGLGVGGVAVALALRNILGDLFASLSIALDKPFMVGDRLELDAYVGKVEHIGIKTTRLRSDSGEQIILSNEEILRSRVRNFARAEEQRVLTTIRVHYETPTELLQSIPKLIEGIVREQPNARFDHCHLKTLGDTALLFELVYFLQQPAIHSLFGLQQAVNFRILEEFRRLGVDVAYEAQHIVRSLPGPATEVPAIEAPATEAPASKPPSTEAPLPQH